MMSTICIASFSLSAATATSTTTPVNENIEPRYEISCPGGGKHSSLYKGEHDVYYPDHSKAFDATLYQCSKCHLMTYTEHDPTDPNNPGYIGLYVTYNDNIDYTIGPNYIMYSVSELKSYDGHIKDSTYWSGFNFIKSW